MSGQWFGDNPAEKSCGSISISALDWCFTPLQSHALGDPWLLSCNLWALMVGMIGQWFGRTLQDSWESVDQIHAFVSLQSHMLNDPWVLQCSLWMQKRSMIHGLGRIKFKNHTKSYGSINLWVNWASLLMSNLVKCVVYINSFINISTEMS